MQIKTIRLKQIELVINKTLMIQIVQITLIDLPFFRWKEEIEQIIVREQTNWPKQWDEKMKTHPEALVIDHKFQKKAEIMVMNTTQKNQSIYSFFN